MAKHLILASASTARARLLKAAGITFEQIVSGFNENELKNKHYDQSRETDAPRPYDVLAHRLAVAKARVIATDSNGLIIGADQILCCGDVIYDKPKNQKHAREQLISLRGQTHELISAVVLIRRTDIIWSTIDYAKMTMRNFSDIFLDDYLDALGNAAYDSVGGYQLEDRGAQLFESIEGDYFTILGLPLLPLLKQLRHLGYANV